MAGTPMELRGKLVVNKVTNTKDATDEAVSVQLIDVQTELIVAQAKISFEDFARTMFTGKQTDCVFRVVMDNLARLGMIRQTKREAVAAPTYNTPAPQIRELLAPLETDGWLVVNDSDIWKYDNFTPDRKQRYITLERFVTPEQIDAEVGEKVELPPLVPDSDADAAAGVVTSA